MTEYSMKSKNRKTHQRWLNKYCRIVNRTMAQDPLWLGRFVVEQKATTMEWFRDKSGGMMYAHLQFRDKKTGRTWDWFANCLDISWNMWVRMNHFIVNRCEVWKNEHPYEEVRDYRNVK